MTLVDLIPSPDHITKVFSAASAPAFFLGGVGAFTSLMSTRLADVVGRMRLLEAALIAGTATPWDIREGTVLKRRSKCLHSGIKSAVRSGICVTALLAILFVGEFFDSQYSIGAGSLFFIATILLGFALAKIAEDAKLSVSYLDLED